MHFHILTLICICSYKFLQLRINLTFVQNESLPWISQKIDTFWIAQRQNENQRSERDRELSVKIPIG
jgi:hypothetical protein